MRKKCLPIEVSHGSEELHDSSCCVQQNGIDANVPICILGVYLSDIWQPCLETMIFIPNKEHMSWKPRKIWVSFHKDLKFIISNLPMLILAFSIGEGC